MPGMAGTLSGPQARPGQGTRRRRLPGLHGPGTCWRQRAGNLDHVLRVGVIPWLCWLPPRLLWSHVLMPGASAGTTGERGACCTRRADPPPGTVGRKAGTELGQPEGRRCGGGPVPGCQPRARFCARHPSSPVRLDLPGPQDPPRSGSSFSIWAELDSSQFQPTGLVSGPGRPGRCTRPCGAPVFPAGWGHLPASFTPLAAADSRVP